MREQEKELDRLRQALSSRKAGGKGAVGRSPSDVRKIKVWLDDGMAVGILTTLATSRVLYIALPARGCSLSLSPWLDVNDRPVGWSLSKYFIFGRGDCEMFCSLSVCLYTIYNTRSIRRVLTIGSFDEKWRTMGTRTRACEG